MGSTTMTTRMPIMAAMATLLLLLPGPAGCRARFSSPPARHHRHDALHSASAVADDGPIIAGAEMGVLLMTVHLREDGTMILEGATDGGMSRVGDDGDARDASSFFGGDYWYGFEPLGSHGELESSDNVEGTRWEVVRVPKFEATLESRRLQSAPGSGGSGAAPAGNGADGNAGSGATENAVDGNEAEVNDDVATNIPVGDDSARSGEGSEYKKTDEEEYYFFVAKNVLLSLTCVAMAALAAGLTLGMLSLDPLSLEIKRRTSSDEKEKRWSEDLLPMLVGHSKRHRLLVSLLLLNSLANEALPLFLDELLPGKYAAIIVSVTLVLFFGEIVPSAFFTGPNQVEVAAKLVPLARAVMFILSPIAVPIAKLLDKVLHDDGGHGSHGADAEEDVTEGNYYNRTELTALVRIQYESQMADKRRRKNEHQRLLLAKAKSEDGKKGVRVTVAAPPDIMLSSRTSHMSKQNSASSRESAWSSHTHHSIRSITRDLTSTTIPERMPSIHRDEITMIEGALSMTTKRAADVYTPLRRVYALPSDTVLDEETKVEIWARGFSRIPIYSPAPSTEPPSADLKKRGSTSSFEDISGIVGVLMVRQLIVVDSAEERPLETLPLVSPSCIPPSMHLVDLMNMFQAAGGRGKGGLHLAIVCARPEVATEALERGDAVPREAGVMGIVTLEDVVEELLQEEIYDEADRDLELSRWGVIKWRAFVKRRKLKRLQQQQQQQASQKNGAVASAVGGTVTESTPLLN